MLQSLPRRRHRRRVYRLAQDSGATRFFEQSGLDRVAVDELLALLAEFGYDLDAVDFLDRPFRPKRARGGPRFSNGSFPVFCSSLDPETTLAEVKHWAPRTLGAAGRRVTASYWQFHCTFDGLEVDLRPQIALWPNRIHDSDYTFCNRIGAAAVRDGLDGLVTWSARRDGGVNLPVFRRRSLSDPGVIHIVRVTYDPDTDAVSTTSG